MDPYLARFERRLDLIDVVLRGDTTGHPGLVEGVRHLSSEQRRQGEELALLRSMPAQLEALTSATSSRDDRLSELGDKVESLVRKADRASTLSEGERQAVGKIATWLKFAAGIGALLLAGGGASIIALLRQLGEIAAAVP